jgi:MEDS: MEthanogen/methylotroph, DcmR Sensory domain
MPTASRSAVAVGVDRLQPGDHAFLAFSDDEERWEILSVFTKQGFARNEKVLLHMDVVHSPDQVAARVAGGAAAPARPIAAGQLVVLNTPRFGPGEFDAKGQVDAVRRGVDAAVREGYSGLRSASEVSLALTPVDSLDQVTEFETAQHEALFAARPNRQFTALCQWDERKFGGEPAMAAVRALHPVTVLHRVGMLHAALTAAGLRLTGDSDLSTRAEFTGALRALASQSEATLVLDITNLSFLDAHSAGAMLRLAAGLLPPRRLEIRCRGAHRRMLRLLDSHAVRQLSIVTDRL